MCEGNKEDAGLNHIIAHRLGSFIDGKFILLNIYNKEDRHVTRRVAVIIVLCGII